MSYVITHTIQYEYFPAVILEPHEIRLQPRTDAYQVLEDFGLEITPQPSGQTLLLDSYGTLVTRCWWRPVPISSLWVKSSLQVRTFCDNPFNYLLEPWATELPIDYPMSIWDSLAPYLQTSGRGGISASVVDWAAEMAADCDFNTVQFLSTLTQTIFSQWTYLVREVGKALPPSVTLKTRQGSCRDFAVLFIAACRAVGIAGRFVSGYEEGDPKQDQTLHAWVEVFLPGAGWRGYDPTLGLAVCDRHIALAVHPIPDLTTPIVGRYRGQTQSSMRHSLTLTNMDAV